MALSLWLCGVIEAYRNCSPRRSLGDKPEVNVCAMTTITCWRAGAAHTDGMNPNQLSWVMVFMFLIGYPFYVLPTWHFWDLHSKGY